MTAVVVEVEVDVVGQGWWADEPAALVRWLGVEDVGSFHGFVDEQAKADLLADRERCAVFGRQARAYVSQFSWDATAAAFARVLAEVTGGGIATKADRRLAVPQPAAAAS